MVVDHTNSAGNGGTIKLNSTTGTTASIVFDDSIDLLVNLSRIPDVDFYIDNLYFKRDAVYDAQNSFNVNEVSTLYGNNFGFDGKGVLGNTLRVFINGLTVGTNATNANLTVINCGYEFGSRINNVTLDNGSFINCFNVYKIIFTNATVRTTVAARNDRHIYKMTQCRDLKLRGTVDFGTETGYGLLWMSDCSRIDIAQTCSIAENANSTFGGHGLLIRDSGFIRLNISTTGGKLTIPSGWRKIAIPYNVVLYTNDENFDNLPFEGIVEIGSNKVTVNNTKANRVDYDNTTSGLVATEVQSAIDEVVARLDTVDGQIAGGVTYKGGYNADTNTPNLTTPPGVNDPVIEVGDMYTVTVAGSFYGVNLEVGDVIINKNGSVLAIEDWTIVNRNIEETASQIGFDNIISGATSTEVQGALDEAFASLAQLSSTAETALIIGTEQTVDFTATIGNLEPVDCTAAPVTVTPPVSPNPGDKFAVVDSRSNSASNNIAVDFATAGQNLYGNADTFTFNEDGAMAEFRYLNSSIGWVASK